MIVLSSVFIQVEWYADETGYHPSAPFLPKSVVPNHPGKQWPCFKIFEPSTILALLLYWSIDLKCKRSVLVFFRGCSSSGSPASICRRGGGGGRLHQRGLCPAGGQRIGRVRDRGRSLVGRVRGARRGLRCLHHKLWTLLGCQYVSPPFWAILPPCLFCAISGKTRPLDFNATSCRHF